MRATGRFKEAKSRERAMLEQERDKSPEKKVEEIVRGILKKGTIEEANKTLHYGREHTSYRTHNVDLHEHDLTLLAENLRVRSTKTKMSNKHKISIVKAFIAFVTTVSDGRAVNLSTWG